MIHRLKYYWKYNTKKNIVWEVFCVFLSLLFSLTLIISDKIHQESIVSKLGETYISLKFEFGDVLRLIAVAALVIFAGIIIQYALDKTTIYISERKVKPVLYLVVVFVFILMWSPYYLTFIPGGVWADTANSIWQCLSNQYSNHHPIFYTLSWKLLIHFVGTVMNNDMFVIVETYVVIQIVLLASTCASVITWIYKRGLPWIIVAISACFFGFFNLFPLYSLSLWKDTPYACFFMLFTLAVADVVIDGKTAIENISWRLRLYIVSLLLIFSRNNMIYIVIATSVALILFTYKQSGKLLHRFNIMIVLLIVISEIITGPVYSSLGLNVDKKKESMGVPFQQIGYILSDSDARIDNKDLEIVESVMSREEWVTSYRPYISDSIKVAESFDDDYFESHASVFLKAYFGICLNNFRDAIEGYLLATNGFWDVHKQDAWGYVILDGSVLSELNGVKFNLWESFFGGDLSERLKPHRYYSSAIFIWLFLAISMLLIKKNKRYVILMIPGVVTWATLMVATPIAFHLRYAIGIVFVLPIMIAMLIYSYKNSK